MSPQVHSVLERLGYFIPVYPALIRATGNANVALVFARLMFHEDMRIRGGAATFVRTDSQLMQECGLGRYAFTDARNMICGPSMALFRREVRGIPAITHYCGDHGRIHAWLARMGFPAVQAGADRMLETSRQELGKPADLSAENQRPLNNFKRELFSDDDVDDDDDDDEARLRARLALAEKKLADWGIENPMRNKIIAHLEEREDIIEIIEQVCDQTATAWAAGTRRKYEPIKSPLGLTVHRLMNA